jgi:aminoglycoside phosphotransferase family enzyme
MPRNHDEPASVQSSDPTLADKRAFLEGGAAWPDDPPPECIETHASFVFLTPERAWKLKKPVKLAHVDQLHLDARARLCREEFRLNRELAGDIYRGLVPLVQRTGGGLSVGGEGRIVDWLIEIVRLPAHEMLDERLRVGPAPRADEIEAFCNVLIAFYRRQPRSPDAGEVYFQRLQEQSALNAAHLREMRDSLGVPLREDVLESGIAALETCRSEILKRGLDGLIVEGHGDLRPEHVCLTRPPVVFDRIEFDHGFRLIDPFDEFNALGIECALLGAPGMRAEIMGHLENSAIPAPSPELLKAYSITRYLTQARLAIDHLRDTHVRTPAKWPTRARAYLEAAATLCESEPQRRGS